MKVDVGLPESQIHNSTFSKAKMALEELERLFNSLAGREFWSDTNVKLI